MLGQKLAALVKEMQQWQKTVEANPSLLEKEEYRQKNAVINKNLPKVISAVAQTGGNSPELEAKRQACITLLRKWHVEQTLVINKQTAFFIDNYLHYYIITVGQTPVSNVKGIIISYTTSSTSALTGEATKMLARNVVGEAIEMGVIAAFTTGGGAIGNVPGAIIGFFVGVTVDYLINKLAKAVFGDPEKEAIADIKSKISDYMVAAKKELTGKMETSLKKLNPAVDRWEKELYAIKDLAVLTKIEKNLKIKLQAAKDLNKRFSATNHPLGNRLLKEWVLENIGDDNDDANDYDYNVNEPAWKLAVQTLKNEGALDKTADDVGKIKTQLSTDVINEELAFLSQVRNELRYTSINIKSPTFLSWAKQVRAYAQKVKGDAAKIKAQFNKAKLTFSNRDILNGRKFVNQIEDTYDGNLIQNWGEKMFGDAIQSGKVGIAYTVEIRLEVYSGTVICDWYYYKMVSSEIVRGQRRTHTSTWQESVDF